MDARRRVKPDDIVDMREQQIALGLMLSGQFDERIIELKSEREALAQQQLVARTLAEAEQIKHAAVQFAESERGEVEGIVARAEEHRLEILSHVGEAKAVLERATAEKDLTASGWIELEREATRRRAGMDKAEADLKRRQEMLAEREASVAGELDKLKLLQDKLKTRLAKLETV